MLGIGGGGAEKVLIDLLKYWHNQYSTIGGGVNIAKDVDLFLIEQNKKDVYYQWCKNNLNKVFTLPHIYGKIRFLNKIWKKRICKNPKLINRFIPQSYDINIGFLEGVSTIFISQKEGGRKVGYIHTSLQQARKGQRDLNELEAYLKLDLIICVSNFVKTSLLSLYPELKNKHIEVIYNPVNKAEIIQKAQEPIDTIKKKFTFLQVGRLVAEKGWQTILEANQILLKEGYDFDIWILGSGKRFKKKIQSHIISNSIANISIFEFQKNPYPYFLQCDVFILASHFEGCPLVLLEACSLGKAIIASNIPANAEILQDNDSLFTVQDPMALSKSMKKILLDLNFKQKQEDKTSMIGQQFGIEQYATKITHLLLNKAHSSFNQC